jgi:3',5'-cyclic AMP phosphodiesterase CpdA
VPRLLHVSDLHFGKPSVLVQVEALEAIVERERFDVIVISGDLSQRTRRREFGRARDFVRNAERHAPVFVVPGNHDVAWWTSPMGLGSYRAMFSRYRAFVRQELEPVRRSPGLTLVGLNSAHGIQPYTLTTRPRDLSVVGALRPEQFARARREFEASLAGDVRVLVFHHNLLRGKLSNRWGLANRAGGIEQAAATGAEVVLCGHDHEARIEQVAAGGRRFVVSTPNTLTDRVRGGALAQFHAIEADARSIAVEPWVWNEPRQTFYPGRAERFSR